ncbi:hypothetical protein [Levilactobacillus namurensis]|uniref:hypothetical protein n=1 Tax=Levilactobacillus namurensis TaxID=380393 RepID=UPI00222E0D3F|nr:hypothetical protein [Levilactobacillus namurensis]MCW3778657.1 hypothetical protein [Levilactobacillus namurensis]MDT7019601.1 hypothetical protein [Levilactobacillus namurensis]WNN65814.1 hypothetical protein RIN67_01605 [Levilactobacillus namurensis]
MEKTGNDALREMILTHGAVFTTSHGKRSVDLRETLKRWIAIWFNGGTYTIEGRQLSDKESEDVTYDLLNLLAYFDRKILRK